MNALIIDDERLARSELRRLLAAHPEITIAGEAVDAADAIEKIAVLRPDLIFLDIQMPGKDGFELLEELESVPVVVFTTAYDEHALRAFDVNALDYLLKPIDPARLAVTIGRLLALDTGRPPHVAATERIFIRDGDRCWFVRTEEIVLLESEGNYTRLYFGEHRPLILRSLNYLESRLDPRLFFRASRRHIVNLEAIAGLEPSLAGGLIATLPRGQRVEVSRRQAQRFKELMRL